MSENNTAKTDFNLHIGGDGVKTNLDVPHNTTLFGMALFTIGCAAYVLKSYISKAKTK